MSARTFVMSQIDANATVKGRESEKDALSERVRAIEQTVKCNYEKMSVCPLECVCVCTVYWGLGMCIGFMVIFV